MRTKRGQWRQELKIVDQSTSSILEPSSPSSSSGGRSSTSSGSSSSSMDRPSLIMRWMRPAKVAGSSSVKPEVRSEVSKSRWTRSLTVLSPLSAAAFALSSFMIECFGLISMVFLEAMYDDIELSRSAWARMMRSMLAVQPYSPVTRTQGDSVTRSLITTWGREDKEGGGNVRSGRGCSSRAGC